MTRCLSRVSRSITMLINLIVSEESKDDFFLNLDIIICNILAFNLKWLIFAFNFY